MLRLNSKGFGLIECLLIFVIVGLIGGAGYYVYNAQKNTNETLDNTGNSELVLKEQEKEQKSEEPVDPTANWVEYTDPAGKYSLKYPKDWTTAKNQNICSPSLLLLGVKLDNGKSTAGICASEDGGQMHVAAHGNTNTQNFSLSASEYDDYTSEEVTVAGASGTRQAGVVSKEPKFGLGPSKGTVTVRYVLTKGGSTYVLNYGQRPAGHPDVKADFELMVNQTFEIK